MGLFDFLLGGSGGGGDKISKLPTKNKGQQQQLNQALQQWSELAGGGYENAIGLLQSLLDPNSDTYQNFAAPFLQQFEQQTIPGIAERFAGLNGMGGGLASSGFGQALGAAGANLQTQLASLRENLRMQGAQGILGQYNQGFGQTQQQEPFMYTSQKQNPSFGQSFGSGISQGLGSAAGNFLSNLGVGGRDQGRGYQSSNPITNQLDAMYRTTGMLF